MRIGIDVRPLLESKPGGVDTYTKELVNALLAHGPQHTWRLFCSGWRSLQHYNTTTLQHLSTELIYKRVPNKFLNLSLLLTGRPHLDRLIPPPLGGGGQGEGLQKNNRQSAIGNLKSQIWISPNLNFTSLSPNTRHIQVIHDLSFIINPSWYSPKSRLWHRAIGIKKTLDRADAIVAISRATAQDIERHFPGLQHKTNVIYLGTPTKPTLKSEEIEHVKKKYSLPPRFFLYVGALSSRKNIKLLLDAWHIFRQTTAHPHTLILAGPGELPSLYKGGSGGVSKKYSKYQIQNTKYLGPVTNTEKHALLELSECLIFPSLYEGFGLPPLEAMSHGKPVIASWSSSLPEVIHDAGLLVSPYKPHELAHAMRMIADNEELKKDLSARATEQAKKFTWEKTANEFMKLINTLRHPERSEGSREAFSTPRDSSASRRFASE